MNRIISGFSCCLLSILLGCGGGANGRRDVYPVSGTIKFAGAPVIGAVVSFTPRDGQPAAVGRTDDQGHYVVTTYEGGDGAAVGSYAVIVMKFAAKAEVNDLDASHSPDGSTPIDSGHNASSAQSTGDEGALLPPIYADSSTTTLSAVVKAEANEFNFELTP